MMLEHENKQLERFKKVTLDREEKMIELKKEINELCRSILTFKIDQIE